MTAANVPLRETLAAEYLNSLLSLTKELERAMQAIAHNRLADLEESVANQISVSTELGRMAQVLCVPLESASPIAQLPLGEDLMRKIRDAAIKLERLNLSYAALLRHSSRSVALMASLFQSFQGYIHEASGARCKQQTWSCQV